MSRPEVAVKQTRAMLLFVLSIMSAYFLYHVLSGDRGLISYIRLSRELNEKKEILSHLQEEKYVLEKKVKLMESDNIDSDTLDELARKNLGLMSKDEEVWIIEEQE